ncbi:MAG: hypothetical protein L6R38_001812 [Xanthoria sp. 2 TBL-2021]|nr:MAG: hypothetical protein L6R38_001812 [Xanthoria sp. 2 TBL-2021]
MKVILPTFGALTAASMTTVVDEIALIVADKGLILRSAGFATQLVALVATDVMSFGARLLTNHPIMKYWFMASLGTAMSAAEQMVAWLIACQDLLKLMRLRDRLRQMRVA